MDRRRRYEQRQREKGLCHQCSQPAVPGKTRCEEHLRQDREYRKRRIAEQKEKRLCRFCGQPLAPCDEGYQTHNRNECIPSRRLA